MSRNLPVSEVIAILEQITGHKYQRTSLGYKGRCPVHPDRSPSLGVIDKNGRAVLTCFAGCSRRSIWEAINDRTCRYNPNDVPYTHKDVPPWEREIEKVYTYYDERGKPRLEKVRFVGKDFMIRRANGSWGIGGEKPLLYNLPQVMKADVVCIVEGEKDADTLTAKGLVATCNIMGAASDGSAKWDKEFNQLFRGKAVLIFADNDAPGLAHAEYVFSQIEAARKHKIWPLPGLTNKMDITDWFDLGYTLQELVEHFPEVGDLLCQEGMTHAENSTAK